MARPGTDLLARSFLLLVGIVAYQNFVKGTLGDWFGAKFFNRAGGTVGTGAGGTATLAPATGSLGGGLADKVGGTGFVMPVQGTITSRFGDTRAGHSHAGIDIAAPSGTPIGAARAGTITNRSSGGDCGNRIDISHGGTLVTRYCHLSSFAVRQGDKVTAGQTIGAVGATGDATGPHLHFEVRVAGLAIDPAPWLGIA